MPKRFPHQHVLAYEPAAALYVECCSLTARVHPRHWPLVDQLLRAASSVALNIAEGATEFSSGDKARFYRMACRSAGEAAAAIDLLERTGQLQRTDAERLNHSLEELIAMLTTLSKRLSMNR